MKKILAFLIVITSLSTILFSQSNKLNYPNHDKKTDVISYTVVIGSMQNLDNANELANKANKKGFLTEIVTFNKNNIIMNRVCVGKSKDRSEANKLLKEIKKKLKINNAWILEIPVLVKSNNNNNSTPVVQERILEKNEIINETRNNEKGKLITQQIYIQDSLEKVKLIEQEKVQADKLVEEQRIKAEQDKVQANKLAEEQRIKAEQDKLQADKLAEEQRIKVEQEKVETEKQEHQKKIQAEKLLSIEKEISKENLSEPTAKPKGMTTQLQTIDSAFTQRIDTTTNLNTISEIKLNEQQKKEFIQKFKEFIEYLRNYEYSKANEFIYPNNHLFVLYNSESKPAVREFPNFEKFFAVFSAFTNKGTSYDFSLDIDMFLKDNMRFDNYPFFDCSKNSYNIKGQIASLLSDSTLKFANLANNYYSELKPDNLSELTDRVNFADRNISVSVMNSDSKFVESFYFGFIDGKWYLLSLDLRIKCK